MTKVLVKCNKCEKYHTVWIDKIAYLKTKMKGQGWVLKNEQAICPDCAGRKE